MVTLSESAYAKKQEYNKERTRALASIQIECPDCHKMTNKLTQKIHNNSMAHRFIVLQREYQELQAKYDALLQQ